MATADEIRAFMKANDLTQEKLAEQVGVSQSTVSRWLKGREIEFKDFSRLRRLMGLPVGSYGIADPALRAEPTGPWHYNQRLEQRSLGDRSLRVFSAAEGGPGEMVVNTDPIEVVPRPWFLGEVREAFAVLIVGDSMEPAFEAGDMAIVNPRLSYQKGKTVILATDDDGTGEFRATIKRLVGYTVTEWKLRQFNPLKDISLSRSDWPRAWRVVGKLEGR